LLACELAFDVPDVNSTYSLHELDVYLYVPPDKREKIQNHRLYVRKNIVTGEFEVCRQYFPTGELEVVFKDKNFRTALRFASEELYKFYGIRKEFFLCTHKYPFTSSCCPRNPPQGITNVSRDPTYHDLLKLCTNICEFFEELQYDVRDDYILETTFPAVVNCGSQAIVRVKRNYAICFANPCPRTKRKGAFLCLLKDRACQQVLAELKKSIQLHSLDQYLHALLDYGLHVYGTIVVVERDPLCIYNPRIGKLNEARDYLLITTLVHA
jgi:hypothetical protein